MEELENSPDSISPEQPQAEASEVRQPGEAAEALDQAEPAEAPDAVAADEPEPPAPEAAPAAQPPEPSDGAAVDDPPAETVEAEAADEPALSMDELLPLEEPAPAPVEDVQLLAVLEAIVYVADEPLTLAQISAALSQPAERIQALLDMLVAEFDKPEHGVTVREVAGGYKMTTKPEHHEGVRNFVKSLKAPLKLSLPALETLAVIAYKQPVTAPEIMEIRGVQGAGVLKTLLDRKLIAVAGRKNVIGKPILYKTTKEFLIQFGLKNLAELPSLKEFEELRRFAFSDAPSEAEPSEPGLNLQPAAAESAQPEAPSQATEDEHAEPVEAGQPEQSPASEAVQPAGPEESAAPEQGADSSQVGETPDPATSNEPPENNA